MAEAISGGTVSRMVTGTVAAAMGLPAASYTAPAATSRCVGAPPSVPKWVALSGTASASAVESRPPASDSVRLARLPRIDIPV